jgi:hypothetical protein
LWADAAITGPGDAPDFQPLTFTLSGDNIMAIDYINSYFGTGTSI